MFIPYFQEKQRKKETKMEKIEEGRKDRGKGSVYHTYYNSCDDNNNNHRDIYIALSSERSVNTGLSMSRLCH